MVFKKKKVESSKCDNVYSNIWGIFLIKFLKIGRVLIHQISLMKNTQSKF